MAQLLDCAALFRTANGLAVVDHRQQCVRILCEGEELFLTIDAYGKTLSNIPLFRSPPIAIQACDRRSIPAVFPGKNETFTVLAIHHFH